MRKTNDNVYFNIHHATRIDAPRDSRRFYDARKPLPTEREARETRTVRSSSRTRRISLKHRLEHYVRASRPSTAPESANEEPNTFRMKKKSRYPEVCSTPILDVKSLRPRFPSVQTSTHHLVRMRAIKRRAMRVRGSCLKMKTSF